MATVAVVMVVLVVMPMAFTAGVGVVSRVDVRGEWPPGHIRASSA